MDFKEWKKQSKVMFDTADDKEYLLCESVIGEVNSKVMIDFIDSKINKTDFMVLNSLIIVFYNKEYSTFVFKDLDDLKRKCFGISKPNLSRSLKALCENGFIEKVPHIDNNINYKFLTAFKKLEELT